MIFNDLPAEDFEKTVSVSDFFLTAVCMKLTNKTFCHFKAFTFKFRSLNLILYFLVV